MSKYLTFDERLEIQKGLKYQMSFGEIAKSIGKDRTTVAKEIKRYSYEQKTGYSSYPYNACKHRNLMPFIESLEKNCLGESRRLFAM